MSPQDQRTQAATKPPDRRPHRGGDRPTPGAAPSAAAVPGRDGEGIRSDSGNPAERPGSQTAEADPATADPTTADPTTPAPHVDAPTTAEPPVQARPVVVPLLAVLAVLVALAVTLATLSVSNHRAVARARTDALAAAKSAATAVLSASYRTVDNDIAAARKDLTPHFRQQYDKIAKGSFRQMVVDNQAIITAQVQAGGVKQASRNRVVVLLFVNQLSTNNKRPVPRLDQPRVRMTMLLEHGAWLVDGMDAI